MAESNQGRMVVSLEDLLVQADSLKKEIDALQKLRDEVLESLGAVKSSKEALNILKAQNKEMLLSVDRRGFVILKVTEIPSDKVLVNLGLGYYAEIPPEDASKILDNREEQLNKSLQEITNRLNTVVNAYSQIAEILNRAQAQQAQGE
ncbi:prefoldin subunit alpha [Metallosphaera tengchongensis]|uniref:Prefoldin subunit alpha n=2 Tax=Metallosphaera tengchongensis TaxID=1532350 RepID=A0A6N0NXG6_9CREN|nr:prefoldin subunit alpha [Metallosphaera tengchongensis]